MKNAFSIQVTSRGVVLNLNPGLSYKKLKDDLNRHVKEASEFFAGVDIYLNINGRSFEVGELQEVIDIVSNYEKVNKIYVTQAKEKSQTDNYKDTILIKRTIRSGQRIKYPTNIVIIGDVNPGAEIIAAGDIVVFGRLRGVVHAGAKGSTEAQVVALNLEPTQLRISSIISRPPEEEKTARRLRPERAFIKENTIIVEEFDL